MKKPSINLFALVLVLGLIRTANAVPIHNSTNGHYYEIINSSVNWIDANTEAGKSKFVDADGILFIGYLATITSEEENSWIVANLGGVATLDHFLGGYTSDGEHWQWVTGEAWSYTNWYGSEPNGYPNESVLEFDDGESPIPVLGKWNDYSALLSEEGYIVEFKPSTPDHNPVPEPTTMLLLGFGLMGLAGLRRKMK